MASKHKNLSAHKEAVFKNAGKWKIAIVVSEYHDDITFALRDGCIEMLKKHGVKDKSIITQLAPGAFELPLVAKWLYDKTNADAVICLGCVIKGDTDHDKYINHAVADALMDLGLKTKT
ncbi:MAG TPA: 6,7-dimethyl-8-ribityllumazine synthase, partial [Chitinophagales bacterium]|nr:6,7-dimethyl-8-ribityllumazine synthase [Chitinophagales bacterium]